MNRFDLEEAISSLWNLSDDINLICDTLSKEGYNEDKILNSLVGVAELNDMRVQRVMDILEDLIKNNSFKNESCDIFQKCEKYSDLTLKNELDFSQETKVPERNVKFCKIKSGKPTCQKNSF